VRIRVSVIVGILLCLVAGGFLVSRHWRHPAVLTSEQKEANAHKRLAFESLTDRLPKGKPISPAKPLSSESKQRWDGFDRNVASYQDRRAKLLKAFHEKTRKFFVASPGAGSEREFITPEMIMMDDYWRASQEPTQPGEEADFPLSPGEALSRVEPNDEFYFYHDDGMRYFLYPTGFGYVKDRAHIAGFKPHGFRHGVPESKHWRVHHVQLIGILSHDEPVVYLTDKLPSMEQVRQGKTRALDYFEEAGLPSMRQGDDLFIAQKGDTLRMLGALRATKTCLQCHDAQIGDLLGAFSYTLRLAPAKQEKGERQGGPRGPGT
jgi:hypothetical protein